MKKTAWLAVALIGLVGPAVCAAAAAEAKWDGGRDMKSFKKENIVRTLKFSDAARAGEVIVDNIFGPIAVEGYSGNDVLLEAEKVVYARDEERARLAEDEVRLDIADKGNTIEVYVDGPFRETESERRDRRFRMRRDPGYKVYYGFTLKVPFKTDLVLSTVTDGDVEVRGVDGKFDVHDVNGKIRLVDVAGSGQATTVNGGVTAVFRRHPDGACLFETVNGDVEVDFPGLPSADFRVNTTHGEVYSDFDVTYLPKAPPVREERREKGGGYVYRSDGSYGVRVGRGGPEIRLETLTGDILIAERSKRSS